MTPTKSWRLSFVAPLVLAALTSFARAQYYAPDTAYHDPVQRVYPVELARILAWLENQKGGPQIAEIKFYTEPARSRLKTQGTGAKYVALPEEHAWTLDWLDADGATLRRFRVSYKSDLLESGATFYRDVLAQFRQQGFNQTLTASDSETSAHRFYEGLADLELNRLLTLRHASARYTDLATTPDIPLARKLAGQLLATASFGLGGQQTLDTTLAARSAAWLALAETPLEHPDAPWAVLLALNHRTATALRHWKNDSSASSASPLPTGWWSHLIEKKYADELCLAAVSLEKNAHALPLFTAAARQKISATFHGDCLRIAFAAQPQALFSAYENAPWLYDDGNIETGHLTGGAWTLAARRDWIIALLALPAEQRPAELSDQSLAAALQAQKENRSAHDASLSGLEESAALLRVAFAQARTPLKPVSTLTLSDLLHHGWETQALHLGARHLFLNNRYGDQELGAKYRTTLAAADAGLDSMLALDADSKRLPHPTAHAAHALLDRLEPAGNLRANLMRAGATSESSLPNDTRALHRSLWLSAANTYRCLTSATYSNTSPRPSDALRLLDLIAAEGNIELCRRALFVATNETYARRFNITPDHVARLSAHLAPSDSIWLTLRRDEIDAMPDHPRAITLEAAYWDNPDERQATEVYRTYLAANDLVSAQRFYDQARQQFGGSVSFSNNLGPSRLMRAILDQDNSGIETALRDSATYSSADLVCQMMAAANKKDPKAIAQLVDASLERYPDRENGKSINNREQLKAFLSLWPALANPDHRDHAKALDYFGPSPDWPSLRWLIAEKLNLSTDEKIRFFGGEKAQREFQFFIAYLHKDTAAFEKLYADLGPPSKRKTQTMSAVLLQYLRADLLKISPPAATDFTPPAPKLTLQQQLTAAYTAQADARLTAALDKLTTADALWSHISELNSKPSANPASQLQHLSAALRKFIETHPSDLRHWDAELMLHPIHFIQAQRQGQRDQAAQSLAALRSLGENPAAPTAVRGTARLTALYFASQQTAPATTELRAWLADYPDHNLRPQVLLMLGLQLQDTDPAAALDAFKTVIDSQDKRLAPIARLNSDRLHLFSKPIDLKLTTLDGSTLDLADFRGKVILIDFWATWCSPCVAEMPALAELYEKHHQSGFEMIGISQDRDRTSLEKFLKTNNLKWLQVHQVPGSADSTATRYGVNAFPTKWLIDRSGHTRQLPRDADLDTVITEALRKN